MWLLYSHLLWAQEDVQPTPPQKVGVVCMAKTGSQNLSLMFNGKRYDLNDQGEQPDTVANDGIATAFIAAQGEGSTDIALYDGPNVLWLGMVPLPPKGRQTWISFTQNEGDYKPIVKVQFHPIDSEQAPKGRGAGLPWFSAWLILGIGGILGFYLRRPPPIRFAAHEINTPLEGGQNQIWGYHSFPQLVDELKTLTSHSTLLLCSSTERIERFKGMGGHLRTYTQDHFEAHEAHKQWRLFSQYTSCLIVLDGPYGLVSPTDAAQYPEIIKEFLDLSNARVLILWPLELSLEGITMTRVFEQQEDTSKDKPHPS